MNETTGLTQQRNAFVVVGVARGGTSAIARALKALGVELGEKLTPGNEKWNPKGFWEDSDIVYKINGQVFSTLNFAPYGIELLDADKQTGAALQPVRAAAAELLNSRFAGTDKWGFKDPSTSKLLPFWQAVFAECRINDNYVIALRHPLAMAESYQRLTKCELELGLLLWLMHMVPAIDGTRGRNRLVISYELLLNDPRLQLERMQKQFHLHADESEINAYAGDFLDKKLRHFAHQDNDLNAQPASRVVPLCARVYQLLLRLARDEINFEGPVFSAEWSEIKNELDRIYPVYCYIDTLLKRCHSLDKQLRAINKSMLWKMLYPLRSIDDFLRSRRQKKRMSRRLAKAYD